MPAWACRLEVVVPTVQALQLSRFTPPPGQLHRRAAVLMLFGLGADGEGEVVLLERAADMRSHASQAAFPGGALDPGEDAVAAALREADEETGLDRGSVRVLGELPAVFLPPSGFAVTPVVGWWERPGELYARDAAEVARVVRAPLPQLLDPRNRFSTRLSLGYRGPAFVVDGLFVWGFTAGLLSRLLELAGIGGPWDPTLERPVPPEQMVGLRLEVTE